MHGRVKLDHVKLFIIDKENGDEDGEAEEAEEEEIFSSFYFS